MGKQLLSESSATSLTKSGSRWKATLVTAGQGSSGFYSEEVLRRYGPAAYAEGMKNWFKHPDWMNDQRDPRDQWGYVEVDNVKYEEGIGLTAEINVLGHWREVVESLAEAGQASLSIYAMGEVDEDGAITRLFPDIQNSVDLVSYPGRPGSALTQKMYESARAASNKPTATSALDKKEGNMDKEILEALNALTSKFDTFATESKAANTAAIQAEADADAVNVAVESAIASYDEKVVAIDAAKLLPSQVESLKVEAKKGADVAPLIESAKKIVDEATRHVTESAETASYVSEGATTDAASVLPKGW